MPEEVQKINLREKFLAAYANLPLSVRKEIIWVLDEEPITWDVAYLEVRNNTERGRIILEKLSQLNLV